MRLPLVIAATAIMATMATIATLGTVACASQPHEAELHAEGLSSVPVSGTLARVAVEGQPLGANIERLSRRIAEGERAAAEEAYEQARACYRQAISESPAAR